MPTPFPSRLPEPPTGPAQIPVCIGDLPASEYHVQIGTITFDVIKHLTQNPQVPGVMVHEDGRLVNALPRARVFERLGRLYGVDLFIRKPIKVLCDNLDIGFFTLPDNMRVNEGVHRALGRDQEAVYDPIIVAHEDGNHSMLDMHTLLLVQTHLLSNVNNVVSLLDRVERVLSSKLDLVQKMCFVLDMLGTVVPYHRAATYFHQAEGMRMMAGRGFSYSPDKVATDTMIQQSMTYQTMMRLRQSITLEDVGKVPDWDYLAGVGQVRTWMGVPLLAGRTSFGMLSLGRHSRTPFNREEKDIADAFTRHIAETLEMDNMSHDSYLYKLDLKPKLLPRNNHGNFIL